MYQSYQLEYSSASHDRFYCQVKLIFVFCSVQFVAPHFRFETIKKNKKKKTFHLYDENIGGKPEKRTLTELALVWLVCPAAIDSSTSTSMLSNWPIPNAALKHSIGPLPGPFQFRWTNRSQVPRQIKKSEDICLDNNLSLTHATCVRSSASLVSDLCHATFSLLFILYIIIHLIFRSYIFNFLVQHTEKALLTGRDFSENIPCSFFWIKNRGGWSSGQPFHTYWLWSSVKFFARNSETDISLFWCSGDPSSDSASSSNWSFSLLSSFSLSFAMCPSSSSASPSASPGKGFNCN